MPDSLRRQLLGWLLLPLASAVAMDAWLAYRSSVETASVVQDRLLLGSARMIAQQLSFEDGVFQHEIPPAALELFQSREFDRIYYRVTTGQGQLLAGYTDLPVPASAVLAQSPYFFAASMRDESVRVVAVSQPVIGSPSALPVVVEVAQTMHDHGQLSASLWLQALRQQLLILALASVLILFGLHRGLQPLLRLRDDVRERKEGSLQPLQTGGIPAELRPLVDSFNDYIERLENYSNRRSRFIQNAAHQLRTPLAVLGVQISDAQRASSRELAEEALAAAHRTLRQTTRLVNQFLTLSSAEAHLSASRSLTSAQCCAIVHRVLEDLAVQAHAKQIDLGFERSGADLVIASDADALREMAVNLIDNAIRYTPAGGVVTVRIQTTQSTLELAVEDNGPGVPAELHEQVFQRFFRIGGGDSIGSGLGLAIVRELAGQCGGQIRLGVPAQGHGLLATLTFTAVTD